MGDGPGFFEAYGAALTPLLGAQGFLALLQGVEEIGLLDGLREPATAAELAEATGLTERRVRTVVQALLLLGDDASLDTDDPGPEARERSVFRVILDGWGVPDRDRDGLAAEFEQAGFVDVRWVGGGAAGPLRIVARKP